LAKENDHSLVVSRKKGKKRRDLQRRSEEEGGVSVDTFKNPCTRGKGKAAGGRGEEKTGATGRGKENRRLVQKKASFVRAREGL